MKYGKDPDSCVTPVYCLILYTINSLRYFFFSSSYFVCVKNYKRGLHVGDLVVQRVIDMTEKTSNDK